MTLVVHAGYQLSTRTGVVLGPDGRPVGRIGRVDGVWPASMPRPAWCWRTHDGGWQGAPTRAAALAALTAHLDKEADGAS